MNGNASRSAAAKVVTLFIIVAGGGCMGSNDRSGGVGGPSAAAAAPTDAPTTGPTNAPTTTPRATPALLRYRMASAGEVGSVPATLSITVPSAWKIAYSDWVSKDHGAEAGAAFSVWQISNRFNHPCTDHTLLKPAPGPGIDELLTALAGQPGISAGPLTDVTVDGYSGKYVELTVATDIATCPVDDGDAPLSDSGSGPRPTAIADTCRAPTRRTGSTPSMSRASGSPSLAVSRDGRRPRIAQNSRRSSTRSPSRRRAARRHRGLPGLHDRRRRAIEPD